MTNKPKHYEVCYLLQTAVTHIKESAANCEYSQRPLTQGKTEYEHEVLPKIFV